jgi:5-methylcytosine-specific restriction endonuclease McrA
MSVNKKTTRKAFREAVFERDRYRCAVCGRAGQDRQGSNLHLKFHRESSPVDLDAHHVTNRNLMPNGGYVKENGISLCPECHVSAEAEEDGFAPQNLYEIIGSSVEKARFASEKLA